MPLSPNRAGEGPRGTSADYANLKGLVKNSIPKSHSLHGSANVRSPDLNFLSIESRQDLHAVRAEQFPGDGHHSIDFNFLRLYLWTNIFALLMTQSNWLATALIIQTWAVCLT